MTLKDAQKYVRRYIDSSFIVQNINKRYECDDVVEDLKDLIAIYNKERECRVFYEIDEGIMSFTSVEILDKYSTEYDIENYNYVHTNLNNALKIFELQNKKATSL